MCVLRVVAALRRRDHGPCGRHAGVGAIFPAVAGLYRRAGHGRRRASIAQPCPARRAAEQRAALVWNMRAALNVAALQCQFEPTLLTVPNYKRMLRDQATS